MVKKICKIYLVISTESTNVTSGQTDTPHRAAKIAVHWLVSAF